MAMHGLIVADAGRARFFTADVRLERLDETFDLIAPEERMQGSDLYTDAQGRDRGSVLSPHTPWRDQQEETFAARVAKQALERLDDGERWIVVAPPKFLGRLRGAFDKRFLDRVVASLDKDYTKMPAHQLGDAIRKGLPPTAGMPD